MKTLILLAGKNNGTMRKKIRYNSGKKIANVNKVKC